MFQKIDESKQAINYLPCRHSPTSAFSVIMRIMDRIEAALRAIKDRVVAAAGEMEEASANAFGKENHLRLSNTAKELHKCADELQNMLMRIRPR